MSAEGLFVLATAASAVRRAHSRGFFCLSFATGLLEEKKRTFHRVERRIGRFSRSVTLPCCINQANVEAEYRDGVLTVKLPKAEPTKTRKVKIKATT
jgi:Hsp20/alpha crystallin family